LSATLDVFVDLFVDLAVDGIGEADVEHAKTTSVSALAEPDAAKANVTSAVFNELVGHKVLTLEQAAAEMTETTVDQVRALGREALRNTLLMVPQGRAIGRGGFVAAPTQSPAAVTGDRYAHLDHDAPTRQLIVGVDGVSMLYGSDVGADDATASGGALPSLGVTVRVATVRFDECTAMCAWPDGARLLIGADAIRVHVEPPMWSVDQEAMDLLDRSVPPHLVVHMPERDPDSIPQPRRPPAGTPAQPSPGTNPLRAFAVLAARIAAVMLAGLLLLYVLAYLPKGPGAASSVCIAAVVVSAIGIYRVARERRTSERNHDQ
jgi:zinc protease